MVWMTASSSQRCSAKRRTRRVASGERVVITDISCTSLLERGAEVADLAELGEDDRAGGVAVKALDLAVGKLEDVAARGVHLVARRCQRPAGHVQRTQVRSLQGQLDHHNVAAD